MVRTLLIRGMLAGLVAGLLAFGFGRIFGEPHVERAIGFEAMMDDKAHAAGHDHGTEEPGPVSRSTQAGLGLFTATTVYAAAFGGLFALVFAAIDRRATDLGPRATAALLAAAGFVAVHMVPSLKYPANPPAIGEAATLGHRTALYFAMMGLSVAAMIAAALLRRRAARRYGDWTASLLALAFYLVAVSLAAGFLPAVDEVPDGFPANLLWHFRVASFGMQAIMWAAIGLLFGWLTERAALAGFRPGPRGALRRA